MKEVFKFIVYKILRKLYFIFNNESWSIQILKDNLSVLKLKKNKKFYFADPFIFEFENRIILLYERYDKINKIGIIDQNIYDNSFNLISSENNILKINTHASYPFIFKEGDNYYLIPETSSLKKTLLYIFDKNNLKWIFQKSILEDLELIDSNFKLEENNIILTATVKNPTSLLKYIEITSYNASILNFKKDKIIYSKYRRNAGFNYNKSEIKFYQTNSINYYGTGVYSLNQSKQIDISNTLCTNYKGIHHIIVYKNYIAFDYKK